MSKNEVGSSTMPHKVNPIDFENAEGNIGLSNAIFSHLSEKLPVSRLQRDLSDSTVLRNIGTAYGYMEIAINSTLKGLGKLEANKEAISSDLEERYELLTEALQSFLRLEGKKDGYDQVKLLSRGQKMDKEMYLKAVEVLIENSEYKKILMDLTPSKYIGLAAKLAEMK
jgi:adenylosuccinate lyase